MRTLIVLLTAGVLALAGCGTDTNLVAKSWEAAVATSFAEIKSASEQGRAAR